MMHAAATGDQAARCRLAAGARRAYRRVYVTREEVRPVKLSARNVLPGTVRKIVKGAVTSHVTLAVGDAVVTASITNEAVAELGLAEGDKAYAVIKATDVMIGKD
jgi:molybdopterin-binding protein